MPYSFARLDEKRKLLGNFEKILKFFDENSIEKLNLFIFIFLFFSWKFVTKNIAFVNNTIFLQQFFSVSGGGEFPPSPLASVRFATLFDFEYETIGVLLFMSSFAQDGDVSFDKNSYILLMKMRRRKYSYIEFSDVYLTSV